jgi:DASH complex subunit ASK1
MTSMPLNQDVSESQIETTTETHDSEETATYDTGDQETTRDDSNATYHSFDPEGVHSDSSFAPPHAPAVSSTPRRAPSSRGPDESDLESVEFPSSLSASMETPLQRLNREIQSLDVSDTPGSTSQVFQRLPVSAAKTPIFTLQSSGTSPFQSKGKGKGKQPRSALREGVLRQNAKRAASPQKYPIANSPARRNPFLEQGQSSKKWDGIVDLGKSPGTPRFSAKASPKKDQWADESDTSLDEMWPPGMSPLQTIRIDIPGVPKPTPRPKREASRHIASDLLESIANQRLEGMGIPAAGARQPFQDFQSFTTNTSTASSIPPPDVSRYSSYKPPQALAAPTAPAPVQDAKPKAKGRTSISSISSLASFRAQQQAAAQQRAQQQRQQQQHQAFDDYLNDEDDSFDDDDDADGGAFQFLVQNSRPPQDNHDSDDSDDDDDGTAHQAAFEPQPYAEGDSFDDDTRGTGTGTNLFAPRGSDAINFNLRGQTLLDDTLGIGNMVRARTGQEGVDSPTPFGAR